ncbi:hypothetical protein L202_02184 [Cryptococcus amylolentus CBS 6039]|uniref:E2 ubiquitin-conjugating enzyme n=3 Tax=Cryptococcus amylolentus TaxID=104669 RepID=A0A1E3HZQ9_9TREE|nr:hypothetical protein L202_02184 [Cryptococcus amylolentus CBS 6039]ODN81819.1 hypothetical protein L202_02184 [Cryptococcus amylolentus CBS 6039]ODO10008.1 hypothetical protein I350_02232 [Cryptococcus amylolentus CBS 6273]
MSLTPQALRLLSRQIVAHRNSPPEGVRLVVDEENLTNMEGWVQGPSGTPYEGGYYKIRFTFGPEFPNLPPKCTMITKIFHPNISKAGEICVDTLKKGWKKEYGVEHVLVTIKCLLIYPNPESALDEEAGKQLLEDYEGYSKYARLMTSIHAMPKFPPAEFRGATSSSERPLPSDQSVPTTTVRPTITAPSPPSSSASKPSPLGTSVSQGQSPNSNGEPKSGDEVKKVVKPAVKTAGNTVGGVKTAAASKVKRGAKRL